MNFPSVTLKIRWPELLGKKATDMPDDVRRARWDEWMKLAKQSAPEMADYWNDISGCENCIHLDGNWCKLQQLPSTVNPYLTLKHGHGIGMACMGAGKEVLGQQEITLFV